MSEVDALDAARALVGRALVGRVAEILAAEGIDVAPLKGALFHIARPSLVRPMMDVDLLVAPSNAGRALRALARSGFVMRGRGDGTTTLSSSHFALDLDLHWRLFQRGLFRLDAAGVLARGYRTQVDGRRLVLPMPLDVYAHLVGHFVRGRHDATDARHLRDFVLAAELWDIDPAGCATHLQRAGLGRAARYVLPLVVAATHDETAAGVLRVLGTHWLDDRVASAAGALLGAHPGNDPWGAVGCHLLNTSLTRSAASLTYHLGRGAVARVRDRLMTTSARSRA